MNINKDSEISFMGNHNEFQKYKKMNMEFTPILTILIPCYNAEIYLPRCLSSVEQINNKDVILLFVNDGSTDNTEKIINNWSKCHKNVKLFTKQNGGYSTAINFGLNQCSSKYIMFMGADDELVPDTINEICGRLRSKYPDILAFTTEKVYEDVEQSTEIDMITQYKHPGFYKSDLFGLCSLIGKDTEILFTRDTSRCFSMKIIDSIRYFGKMGVSADGCFSTMVSIRANSFEFVNKSGYLWHLHKDSVSGSSKTVNRIIEELEVWTRYFNNIKELIIQKKLPDQIINQFFSYQKTIIRYAENDKVKAKFYKTQASELSKWFFRNTKLSLRSRVKLMFPKMYLFYCN